MVRKGLTVHIGCLRVRARSPPTRAIHGNQLSDSR